MTIFGIDFNTSDFILLGIAGAVAIFLIVNRLVGSRNDQES